MTRFWRLLLLMVFIILADQFSKGAIQNSFRLGEVMPLIPNFFDFTYAQNPGAAWSFGATASKEFRVVMFLILPVIAVGIFIYMLIKSLKGPFYMSLVYALIISGAIGNLIDRFAMGYVVDFISVHWYDKHFPVFNIADTAISIAFILIVIDSLFLSKGKQEETSNS